VPTGAITDAIVTREPAPPTMTEEDAVAAILEGHRARAYSLPAPVLAAAEGAAAVVARAFAVHAELSAAETALAEGAGRLVATIVRESATSGTLSKTDPGAEMVRLEAAVTRIRHESAVYFVASERIEAYPATIARSIAGDVHAALDAGLGALLASAGIHSERIGALEAGSDNLRAHRADPAGFDALEALTPRLAALELARQAMARLQRPWEALPADDGAPPVIRLARMAAG
jgi:hypothetical protein